MRITFLGTGTSAGVPMIGCDCATCRSSDLRDRRLRPSIYIELPDGTNVLVDASPDLRAQALARQFSRVDAILLTHAHADHVLGLDDVRGFNVRMRRPIPCYGDAQTMGAVRRMFAYIFDPGTPRGGGIPQLVLHTLVGPFSLGQATFVPVPVYHGKSLILWVSGWGLRVPHRLQRDPGRLVAASGRRPGAGARRPPGASSSDTFVSVPSG